MESNDVHAITRVNDGEIEVYFSAQDLSTWLRSDIHAKVNQPILEAVADMIDVCALAAVLESVDSDNEH